MSLRRSRAVLLLTLIVLAVSLFNLTKIKTLYAIHDIEDPSLHYSQIFREARKDFNFGSSMFVIFKPSVGSAFTNEQILKVRTWIALQDFKNSNLQSLGSPFDIRTPQVAMDQLWYFRIIERNLPEEILELKKTPWLGILTDNQAHDLAAEFTFKENGNTQFYGSFDPRPVGELLKDLAANFKKGSYFVSGEALFQYFCHEGIDRNNQLNFLLLAFLLFAFRLLFGTWRSGLTFVFTLSIMAVVTFGAMAFFEIPVDLISSGLFLMLAVAALEDFLFFCSEQLERQTPWKKAMRVILVPSFFTSLTTMIGFGSLVTTQMLIMKRFGTWAAFGSLLEWISCFLILPALMSQFSYFRNLTNAQKAFRPELVKHILKWQIKRPFARLFLLVFVSGIFALSHLHISGAPKDMLTSSHPFIQGLDELKSSRGWEGVVQLIFENDRRSEILEKITKLDNVAQVFSPAAVESYFAKNLRSEQKELVLNDLRSTEFYKSFFSQSKRSRAILYVRDTHTEPMMKLLRAIEVLCGVDCSATSESAAHAEFSARVPQAFVESFATSLAMVCFILLLLVGLLTQAPRPYVAILLSTMWGPFVILSLFWLFDTNINFMACLFMTVLIGLAGDNAIQFLFAARKSKLSDGLSRRGSGSLFISLLIASSCLVFLGSYFVSPRIYGLYLALGILVSTFGDIYLLKAFVHSE